MKKILSISCLFVALFVINTQLFAAKVSVAVAQTAALNFFKVSAKNTDSRNELTATLKYTKTETDGTVDFYVFDMSPVKGFVIISADDQVKPVIAYSMESNFNTDTKGRGVQNWMNHAGAHIYRGIQRNTVANAQISGQWAAYLQGQKPASAKSLGVEPLLTTTWDQEPFYNQFCPYNNTDHQRTVTGCVATAMAQIMKFWNFPAQGTGSYGYNDAPPTCSFTYGNQFANFGATTYNWAAMPKSIDSANVDVATLMYQCGVAVAMNYGDDNQGGSGAYVLRSETASWKPSAQMAYATYFSYNPNTLTGVRESDYSATDWINLMKSELSAGRPIQYEGVDTNEGGHTWVCDGYDENDMLHMNWGWSGLDNGYYSVSSLTAEDFNFSSNEAALIGIQPMSDLTVTALAASTAICKGGSTTLSAQGSSEVSYSWTPVTGLSCPACASTVASPAVTTIYTLTIDSAGFSAASQVMVRVNNLKADTTEVTEVSCFGAANGAATVHVSGGRSYYTYLWNNGDTTASALNLTAGIYGVTISDAMGCTISSAATVTQPDSLKANISITNAVCSLTNAVLTVSVTGGVPDYSYSWNQGQQNFSVSALVAGAYSVTVVDAAHCSVTSSFEVTQPASMYVTISSVNTTCSLLYGTASTNVTGGHQNFSFVWNNGETTPSITNLSAGNYTITVTDSLGCSASSSVFFIQPDSMNVSIATSNTVNDQVYGKAIAKVTGGLPQYSFFWNTGDTTESIEYASAGIYTVTITDSKGCAQVATTRVTETTGVNQTTDNLAFEVYPNPATTRLTVQSGQGVGENTGIEIRNILGQTLMNGKLAAMETQIDLSDFAAGVYLVVLSQGSHTSIKQVVVKK